MEIRAVTSDERGAVGEVIAAAFDGSRVPRLWAEVRQLGWVHTELAAYDDGLVGHVGLSRAWLDARERLVDVLVLSPLSTRPDRQGQGVGTALVAAALRSAVEAGEPLVFLEGSPAYYASRGFESAAERGFLPPTERIPRTAFQVAVDPAWQGGTGRLVYPDVWWRHDAAGLRDPRLAELEELLGTW